jgi:hypothetical protein
MVMVIVVMVRGRGIMEVVGEGVVVGKKVWWQVMVVGGGPGVGMVMGEWTQAW